MSPKLAELIAQIRTKQIEYINKVAKSALELYVPSEVVREVWDTEPKEALAIIKEWLSNPAKRCFLLRGDSGAGKTLFMQWLTLHLWENYQEGQPIPLFIPLLTQKDPSRKLLDSFLKKSCDIRNKEELALIKQQPLLLILDGFDEMHKKVNLYESNEFCELPALKVLITCRSQWLATIKEYQKLFYAYEASGKSEPELLESYMVHSFTKEQTKSYLQRYVEKRRAVIESETSVLETSSTSIIAREDWMSWKTYQKYIEKIIGLSELLSSPFVLSLLVETLPSLLKDYKEEKEIERLQVLRIDLYREFVNGWFKRQRDKLLKARKINHLCPVEEAFRVYSESLAQAMLRAGITGVVYEEFEGKKVEQRDLRKLLSVIGDEGDRENVSHQRDFGVFFLEQEVAVGDMRLPLSLIRSGCPLMQIGNNEWSFLHKSLSEYFGAEHLFKSAMLRANIALGCELNEKLLIDEPSLEFLVDRVKEDVELKQRLFAVIEESKYEGRVEVAAANAITILNRAKVSLSGQDFRRVKIRGADLSEGLLEKIDLREADLREVNFTGARLNRANLSGTLLQDAFFGELPYLEVNSSVQCVAYSPDGEWFAAGENSGYINLYDAKTYKRVKQLKNWGSIFQIIGNVPVYGLCFSPDSKILAAGGWDKTIRLWEVATGRSIKTLEGHMSRVNSVAFSADGATLASSGYYDENDNHNDNTIRLWEVATGCCTKTLEGHTNRVNSVAFSSDGAMLASGSWDKTIRLWEAATGRCTKMLKGYTDSVTSVVFSQDGATLASGSWDKTICLWEVATGRPIKTLEGHADSVTSVVFSRDSTILASGSEDKTIRLWEVATGRVTKTLEGHTNFVSSVVFSRDGATLASGSYDNTIRLWKIATERAIKTLEGHTTDANSVVFSRDGTTLVSGNEDNTIRLWEVATGRVIKTLEGHTNFVSSVVFSRDGAILASGSWDNTIRLLEVSTGRAINMLEGHTDSVTSVVFSRDGVTLASGSWDSTIRLWEVTTGRFIKVLRGHTDWVRSVVFSRDGATLASGSGDSTIHLWEVSTGRCIKTLDGHTSSVRSVVFSRDGATLASGSYDNTIRLWKVATGRCIKKLEGHTSGVTKVAFTSDEQCLISASYDKTVRFWQAPTWSCVKTLHFDAPIHSLSLSKSNPQILALPIEHEFWIYELVIQNNLLEPILKTCWGNRTTLICHEANVGGAVGLSEHQFTLFSQRKALGKPSEKTTEKVLEGLHALILYNPENPIKTLFEQNNFVTPTQSFVTIVRKKDKEHTLLVIETIENNHYIIKQAELFLDERKPSNHVRFFVRGEALIEVITKPLTEMEFLRDTATTGFKTFSITPEQAKQLLNNIDRDRNERIGYLSVGNSSLYTSVSRSSDVSTHSCFTWCLEHLNKINVNTKCLESWLHFFVAKPSYHIK